MMHKTQEQNRVMPWDYGKLLDVHAVADRLGCSPATVRRLADAGRMPRPVKLGWLVRWNPETIQEWIQLGCPRNRDMARKGGVR